MGLQPRRQVRSLERKFKDPTVNSLKVLKIPAVSGRGRFPQGFPSRHSCHARYSVPRANDLIAAANPPTVSVREPASTRSTCPSAVIRTTEFDPGLWNTISIRTASCNGTCASVTTNTPRSEMSRVKPYPSNRRPSSSPHEKLTEPLNAKRLYCRRLISHFSCVLIIRTRLGRSTVATKNWPWIVFARAR
jgi:hypothetical protein